jgi:ATP-dependent Zn protease
MKKKGCLLLLAAVIILIGSVLSPIVIVLLKDFTGPKPVEISETDFMKLLQSHQIADGALSVAEVEGAGKTSHSVTGSYKNPHPPGDNIPFETAWVDGSPANLLALIKKEGTGLPPHRSSRPTLVSTLFRLLPFALFLLIAWFLFRREISSIFRPGE